MTIGLQSVVVRAERRFSTAVDDELVVLNPDRGSYLWLDPVGRSVWELIERPCQVADLCQRLSLEFDATAEQIGLDMPRFLAEMADEGIVRVVAP